VDVRDRVQRSIVPTADRARLGPAIEFCGSVVPVARAPFTIGRDADLVVDDDNPFLHRRFLRVTSERDLWWLANVGRRLTASVADADGRLEAFLAPGGFLPLVFAEAVVRFTAGPTSYELSIRLGDGEFPSPTIDSDEPDDATVGRVTMTPDQLRLIVALAEPALRGAGRTGSSVPPSADAARRLGWTITKFNRKLDNVCHKLAAHGVRGLHGSPGRLASNRRARLAEHALTTRLVTRDHLRLLEVPGDRAARPIVP
jgi:hypothetical protein